MQWCGTTWQAFPFKRKLYLYYSLHFFQPARVQTRLQLVPTAYSEVRARSASKSRSISRASRASVYSRPDSIRTAPPGPESLVIYPETFECDDLSYLPPPKRILPKRDVPWVFRYKVKRNMNELSKIMASKPPPMVNVWIRKVLNILILHHEEG